MINHLEENIIVLKSKNLMRLSIILSKSNIQTKTVTYFKDQQQKSNQLAHFFFSSTKVMTFQIYIPFLLVKMYIETDHIMLLTKREKKKKIIF